jgi:hypothetical protein
MSSQMDDDPIVPQPVDRPNDGSPNHSRMVGNPKMQPVNWTVRADNSETFMPGSKSYLRQHRRTGVIIGLHEDVTEAVAANIRDRLEARFPGVTVGIVTGSTSVAFEWDADEQSHDLRAETDQIETTGPGDAYQTFVPGRTRYFVGDREITEAQLRSIGLHVQGPA